MPSSDYYQCKCQKCARKPSGYDYQTKDTIRMHKKRFGVSESQAIKGPLPSAEEVRPPLCDIAINKQSTVGPSGSFDQSTVPEVPAACEPDILNGTLDALLAAGALPAYPRPVRTLESAKRRLGIDADQYITQYIICPQCWKHYTPKQVSEFDSPACLVDDCEGILYDEVLDGKGRRKRQPKKVNPYTSIIDTLRRFFMRPGFAKMIKDSRGHQGGHNGDEDFVMHDIYDGAGWDQCYTNTVREVGNMGSIRDVARDGGELEKLTSHRYGLHLTLNTDW
ncbi:hypothetical protein GALMADRAFT_217198 [Galerina marginata CBS 339.88]|uniref:Uncharacterized protein n=1 Tax=Galerina marginata (strain CBS 339.88) TaxID=685588 RepID=A0A067S8H2_GALM3|nr:hypothetical protein GALMADRAFT_217198 [Galerina marginata CBS 339.88]